MTDGRIMGVARILRGVLCAGALVGATQAVAAQSRQIITSQETLDAGTLHLRGLDTLNGTTQDIDIDVGETRRFGQLEIVAEACRVPRADPAADAYALLRIRDVREANPRFGGWMFASSPALSALDHPRYDVWVLSCSSR